MCVVCVCMGGVRSSLHEVMYVCVYVCVLCVYEWCESRHA